MMSVPSISALTAGISFSACTQAFTKNPISPSFTPCFFSKASRYSRLSCMTVLTSTSLNVVSMAAVSCASFSRLAMVWRSRVMRTRSSRVSSCGAIGGRGAGGALGFGSRASSEAAAVATAPDGAAPACASTSCFRTCPRRPEPTTLAGESPVSARYLRAAGDGCISAVAVPAPLPLPLSLTSSRGEGSRSSAAGCIFAGLGGSDGFTGAGAGCGAAAAALTGAGFTLPSPSAMAPSTDPTATVSPALTTISESTPEAGAGTSTVTLSVSSSTRGSSAVTASPACLYHWPTVASVTDSPSVGTRISVAMTCRPPPNRPRLAQSLFEQRLQFQLVLPGNPSRRRRRGRAPGVARPPMPRLDMVEHPLEIWLDEAPRSHVLRLFLAPHHLGLGESRQLLDQRPRRKRVELLDAQEIDVVHPALLALLVEIVIDLAGAEHHALD